MTRDEGDKVPISARIPRRMFERFLDLCRREVRALREQRENARGRRT